MAEIGRPSLYTEELADHILERIVQGESLRAMCSEDGMPAISSVFKWLAEKPGFSDKYAMAKEEQAEAFADEIVAISDEECTMVRASKHPTVAKEGEEDLEVVFDSTAVARNRLRVDARKWVASKLKPKKYGERVQQELSGPDGGPIQHEANITLEPGDAYRRLLDAGLG